MANTENITAWVEALRSGDYKQGKGALRTADGDYCCLGVACEISPVVERQDREYHPLPQYVSKTDYRDRSQATLPAAVQEWLGLEAGNPYAADDHGVGHTLATWNDVEEADFDKIADLIELKYLRAA